MFLQHQTPLDTEIRPLEVQRGSNLSFSRELPSDDVIQEIVREVPSWGSLVDDWVDYHDPSVLVHLYRQVDELFTSQSPSVVNGRTLMKSEARKTTW